MISDFNFKEKNYLELKEGDVVFSRGDKSENMYLLIHGRIKLKTYENPRQPKVYLVSKMNFSVRKNCLIKQTAIPPLLQKKIPSLVSAIKTS
jgi:hypothetical protein